MVYFLDGFEWFDEDDINGEARQHNVDDGLSVVPLGVSDNDNAVNEPDNGTGGQSDNLLSGDLQDEPTAGDDFTSGFEVKPIGELTNLAELVDMTVRYSYNMARFKRVYEDLIKEREAIFEKINAIYESPEEDAQTYMYACFLDRLIGKLDSDIARSFYQRRHIPYKWAKKIRRHMEGATKEDVERCFSRSAYIMKEAIYRGELLSRLTR